MLRIPCIVWLGILIAMWAATASAKDRFAQFPGAGVELPQPAGFVVSDEWQGLKHEPSGGGVMVMTMTGPLAEVAEGFTPDILDRAQMTLHSKIETKIAGKQAVLVRVTQMESGTEIGKWVGAFGDEELATALISFFPEARAAELSDVLKSIVMGARSIEMVVAAPGTKVDFVVGPSKKLKLASEANNTLVYTEDGRLKQRLPDAPMLTATKSVGPAITRRNFKRFALQAIKQTDGVKIDKVERNQTSVANHGESRYEICETTALGKHEPSGVPLYIYQRVVVAGEEPYIIRGIVGAERRKEFDDEFRDMADGFRVVPQDDNLLDLFGGAPMLVPLGIVDVADLNPLMVAPGLDERPMRTWQSAKGRSSIEARLVDIVGRRAKLETTDGRTIDVPISGLSESDREYLDSVR
jgi:hypothetical protein